jgi:3-deoxy-D-manno-octulosonate 8-phosphate phosphatase (KDO 8-P phosphatase)
VDGVVTEDGPPTADDRPPPESAADSLAKTNQGMATSGTPAAVGGLSSAVDLRTRARPIRLLLTDSDGVLTDNGVYYSAAGEEMKRFSIRDGMGVERLRVCAGVEVGIITGEHSGAVQRRAEKLAITELHLGVRDKPAVLAEILARRGLSPEQVAYIGDDTNDVAVMQLVGLAACPADATPFARAVAHYVCPSRGGYGAFRDFAELIIAAKAEDQ